MKTTIPYCRVSRCSAGLILLLLTRVSLIICGRTPYESLTTCYKVMVDGSSLDLTTLGTLQGVRSAMDCNRACSQNIDEENRDCDGFRFESSAHTCHLYSPPVIMEMGSGNVTVVLKFESIKYTYPPAPPMPENPTFIPVSDASYRFGSYYTSELAMTFEESRVQCAALGGYMMDLTYGWERPVALHYWKHVGEEVPNAWVGVIRHQGQWVTLNNLAPLSSMWLWVGGFPTSVADEDCAVQRRTDLAISNHRCDLFFHYLCENEEYLYGKTLG